MPRINDIVEYPINLPQILNPHAATEYKSQIVEIPVSCWDQLTACESPPGPQISAIYLHLLIACFPTTATHIRKAPLEKGRSFYSLVYM